jgi:predicted  nucleic acid-binding Zn-ribbon protein
LELLVEVQDLDIALAQLEHRRAALPERRELAAAEARLTELDAQAADLARARQVLLDRQAEMDQQVAALSARRQALEDRMYAARGSPARDLQAMDDEINHLAQRRAEIEDAELAVMEEQEPLDAELAWLADERSQLETAAGSLRTALVAAEAAVMAEISTLERSRGKEAARLPTALFDHYEVLRARLGGVGAARLVGRRCDGCHLELPSAEVDRIRHQPPGTIVTCDQCGRILVRVPAGAPPPAPAGG